MRVTEDPRSIDDSKTGVGDLQLRTKYHLLSRNGFNLASGLNLRLPTGDEDDFQGLGDTTLTPFFSVAQEYGRFDFHLAAGVEINADDTDRSRVRYAAGVTAGIIEPLAFLVDVIGHSNVTDQELSVTVPTFRNVPDDSLLRRLYAGYQHRDPRAPYGHRRPGARLQGRLSVLAGRLCRRLRAAE